MVASFLEGADLVYWSLVGVLAAMVPGVPCERESPLYEFDRRH